MPLPCAQIGALEFDEARRKPERAEPLGDGYPDFAGQRVGDGVAGAQQIERCRFHALRSERWNSTRRGESQNVPSPSVTATRTSPDSVLATESLARSRSNDAASMRSDRSAGIRRGAAKARTCRAPR